MLWNWISKMQLMLLNSKSQNKLLKITKKSKLSKSFKLRSKNLKLRLRRLLPLKFLLLRLLLGVKESEIPPILLLCLVRYDEVQQLFAIFAGPVSMSLRDTTSAKTQDSTVTSTVAGVATEEAMLFEAKPAIRGKHQSSAIPSEHGITASLRCNICKGTITHVRNGYYICGDSRADCDFDCCKQCFRG